MTVVFWVLVAGNLIAQKPPRMSKEELIAQKWEFVVEHARLSPADAAKIHPVFEEYELKVWELLGKNREVFRSMKKNGGTVNYEPVNEALVNFDIQKSMIQKKYYLKLKEVTDARTINKMLNAERFYRKDLIQGMSHGKNAPQSPGNK